MRSDEGVLLRDPIEEVTRPAWSAEVATFRPGSALGEGWQLHGGIDYAPRYYLFEWRSANGFDEGLRYGYNTVFSGLASDGAAERRVDRVAANVPGMVVWLRDTRFGNDNAVLGDLKLLAEQSEGPREAIRSGQPSRPAARPARRKSRDRGRGHRRVPRHVSLPPQ